MTACVAASSSAATSMLRVAWFPSRWPGAWPPFDCDSLWSAIFLFEQFNIDINTDSNDETSFKVTILNKGVTTLINHL